MSPSLAHLWDHRVILYRFPAETVDANGDPVRPAPVVLTTPSGKNARADTWSGPQEETPVGESQSQRRRWFLDNAFTDVHERDILDVTEGPSTGFRFRIVSVHKPTSPTAIHHIEVSTDVYTGTLT